MDVLERLKVLINSSTPIIVMETVEETRAVSLLRTAGSDLNLPIFEWTIADGLQRSGTGVTPTASSQARLAAAQAALAQAGLPGVDVSASDGGRGTGAPGPIANTREPAQVLAHIETLNIEAVFVLKDFQRHLDDAVVIRRLRDVAQAMSASRRAVVLTGPSIPLPPELEKEVEYLDLPMPDKKRLREIIEETYNRIAKTHTVKRTLDDRGLDAMAANLCGLTEEEAERTVAQVIVARYALSPEAISDVLYAKKEILRRSGTLEVVDVSESMASVGGLDNLKRWLQKRRGAFDEAAKVFGLEPPRGMVIMGVQGCGKSMCARAIAGEWKLPLVKFNSAAVFDKYIGETEKRLQKLFRVAEQLAPVVLWIDELEKVFAGSGPDSASADAGVSSRLLGAFLSWMQDRKAPVFVAATSNNVNALPPELIRKGRFDEIFFVDLPNATERRAILTLHLARRKRDLALFDLDRLVAATEGYSGAEIEAAVQSGMYASFSQKKPMDTVILLQEIQNTVPLSATRAEDVARLRAWAQERAVPASAPESPVAASA